PPAFAEVGAGDWAPPEIEAVVMRALAKSPNDRPGSARELADVFQKALKEIEQRPDTDPEVPAQGAAPTMHDTIAPPTTDVVPTLPALPPFDANTIVHQLHAWMPDTIATYKLRGFVQDSNGEVLESVPGRIKMRIVAGAKDQSAFSWLGIGKKSHV